MPYLIAAVLLIFIIGLIIYFRSLKKEKQRVTTESAVTYPEETVEESLVAPALEEAEEADAELEATEKESVAVKSDYEAAEEAVEEETEQIAESVEEEEFVELSFDSDEVVEAEGTVEEEEFVEISLAMEEDSAGPVEEIEKVAEEADEDIDVAPALADSPEESEITVAAAPEELTEKLDYYFGGDEETAPSAEEAVAEIEETGAGEEVAEFQAPGGEPVFEPEMPAEAPAEEIMEPYVPVRLTRDKYEADLHSIESGLRQELRDAIDNKESEKRGVLEYKLQAVCEKLASIEDNFIRQEQLIETAGKLLDEVQNESLHRDLPGFDIEEAIKQLQLGNYAEVEATLGEASLQLDHESELASRVYYICGQLAEERLDCESALEDYRNASAAESENENYLLAAGLIARIMGNDKDAQFWLEKVVRQGLEKDEQTLLQATAQYALALVCVRAGQKEKAGALFKRAFEIREKILGKEHPDLGPLMHDYAALFESNGMYEQAEGLYKTGLEVMEKRFGSSHPKLGSTLNRLAGLYEEMELGERSRPLYERALAIKEQVLGKEHHEVGSILNNLAELLRRQGKPELAEPMFKRSLAIAENELGKDHPNLAVVLNNLAELYSQMGREEEASRCQERAFSLFELPGVGGDFVEMEKDDVDIDDDKNTTIAGR